jgi:hypothetical protein
MTNGQPVPAAIMQLGVAFWGPRHCRAPVKLGVLTALAHDLTFGENVSTARTGTGPRAGPNAGRPPHPYRLAVHPDGGSK